MRNFHHVVGCLYCQIFYKQSAVSQVLVNVVRYFVGISICKPTLYYYIIIHYQFHYCVHACTLLLLP